MALILISFLFNIGTETFKGGFVGDDRARSSSRVHEWWLHCGAVILIKKKSSFALKKNEQKKGCCKILCQTIVYFFLNKLYFVSHKLTLK